MSVNRLFKLICFFRSKTQTVALPACTRHRTTISYNYNRAKSKIGLHCDGRNFFFFQLSFLSNQKPRHFMYITWINNHCTLQKKKKKKHQRGTAMINWHVSVETHLKVRRTEFCSKIPSVAKIHFRLSVAKTEVLD